MFTVIATNLPKRWSLSFSLFERRSDRGARKDSDTGDEAEEYESHPDGLTRYPGNNEPGKRYDKQRQLHSGHKHSKKRWLVSIVALVLVVVILLALVHVQMQAYTIPMGDMAIGQIRVVQTHVPHQMKVVLTFRDNAGYLVTSTPLIAGDEWCLHTDIVTFAQGLSVVGLHSGLRFMSIEGYYTDPTLANQAAPGTFTINSSDDTFFNVVHATPWAASIVAATYSDCTFLKPDGQTYDLFISQNRLIARPSK